MFDHNDATTIVKDHPKLVGILFALMLVLSQAGAVSAGAFGAVAGP